jgi:anti-sigma B factor antagonist
MAMTQDNSLAFRSARAGGASVLALDGSVDAVTSHLLDARLDPLLSGASPRVLLDFAGVGYISSAGLRSILLGAKTARARDGEFALCGLQRHVREAFEVSGFAKILPLYASREAYLSRSLDHFSSDAVDCPLQRNKNAVLRFLMILQFSNYSEMPLVTDPSMVTRLTPSLAHGEHGNQLPSAGAFEEHLQHLHSLQDIDIVIESMIAEGDQVATNNITHRHYKDGRYMATRYMSFYRLSDGKIVEKIDVYDRLHEQQQLAARPPAVA